MFNWLKLLFSGKPLLDLGQYDSVNPVILRKGYQPEKGSPMPELPKAGEVISGIQPPPPLRVEHTMVFESCQIIWHVPEGRDDLIPKRATPNSMAYDLVSPTGVTVPKTNQDGVGSILVNTLVAVTLPPNHAMVLRSRSGLASKSLITVEAGEIDTDYRGIIKVLLYNHSDLDYVVKAGDRIAQARVIPIPKIIERVDYTYPDASATNRGAGGFGSTGR